MTTAAAKAWPPRASPLDFAALAFLCAPLLLFFATFTPYLLAAASTAVIVVLLWRIRPASPMRGGVSAIQIILCVAVAAVFLWACSYLAPAARTWDWFKHFSVVNELGLYPWPPVNEESQTFLRYYLGFYMLPGLGTKFLGDQTSFLLIFAQTWVGLSIALALAVRKFAPARPAAFLVIFLLFGGLDLIGYYIAVDNPQLLAHKEWWAGEGGHTYQGLAPQFIWAPQHMLPGLLGLLLVLPDAQGRLPHGSAVLLFAALAFWTPFVALGLVPIALAATWGSWKAKATDWGNIACGVVVVIPLASYLLAGSTDIPRGFNWLAWKAGILHYAAFVLLEFGLLLIALRVCGWVHLRYPTITVTILLVLPWFTIGIYNDLAMRSSIPALLLVAFAAASTMSDPRTLRVIPLALVLALGATGSVLEMIGRSRDGHIRMEDRSLRSGFLAEDQRYAKQYAAPLPHWTIRR